MLVDPFGVMMGVDGYYRQTAQDGMPNVEQQTASTGADVAMALGLFYLHSEALLRGRRARAFAAPRIERDGDCAKSYEGVASGHLALDGATHGRHLALASRLADAPAATGDLARDRAGAQPQLTF